MPLCLPMGEAIFEPLAEAQDRVFDFYGRPDQTADDEGEGEGEDMARLEGHLDADDDGRDAGGREYRRLEALGEAFLQEYADEGARDDGEGVDHCREH